MSYFQNTRAAHPAETIVEVLQQDNYGNPILWVGGDNRVYGFDERGQLADFTDWYMSQQQQGYGQQAFGGQAAFGGHQAFGGQAAFGNAGYNTYGRSGYEPSPATSPRGFSRGGRAGVATNNTAAGSFGYDNYGAQPSGGFTNRQQTVTATTTSATSAAVSTRYKREKKDVVVEDFKPLVRSEMIPLYDEEREKLEIAYDNETKYFKIVVKPK